jgi:ABC-type multidrug transport system fused ATPase/permease subunit
MGTVFGGITNIGWMQRQMLFQIADIGKFDDMLAQPLAVVADDESVTLAHIAGNISFNNVSFAYPQVATDDEEKDGDADDEDESADGENKEQKGVMRDVSFTIEAGKTVAIVGHSGAGKTTIVNLLLRGYDPDQGMITIDGTDLRTLDHKAYLALIGYVPQHVELFDETLRYNLEFARHGTPATDEEIDRVAAMCRIDQFYDRLGEKKFDTLIGENGVKLSGGERQRVGIARALLKNPELLIFDEATSSLDTKNEALIHEALREALKGRTGIIIAHRLSTIRDADKIIAMDGGRVVGVGSHDELLATCPPYAELIAHQMVT